MITPPPESESELLERAGAVAGRRLSEIAAEFGVAIPSRSTQAKGWAGMLLETVLGATAASLPEPDFQRIGIELKTVPVGIDLRPRESTYICTVPTPSDAEPIWERSLVKRKLARVLWVPLVCEMDTDFTRRRIGAPMLWSPSVEEETLLRTDWEELMDLVCVGRVEDISAHQGTYLQIRPKAANASVRRRSIGRSGAPTQTLPRGFYLRSLFTGGLFERFYARGG